MSNVIEQITGGINNAVWLVGNKGLNVVLGFMETINPRLPDWILRLVSKGLLESSCILNHRWLLDPLMSVVTTLAVPSVGMQLGVEAEEDTDIFFRMGIDGYKSNYGSAQATDPENCFFPNSLRQGPVVVVPDTSPMLEKRNAEIALSCCLLSLLSYRHDPDIEDCMIAGMLPETSFLSVHTRIEGDLAVFVADDKSWAVFCFRGTEPETLRDWCTSVLLSAPAPFMQELDPQIWVRARYFQQMTTIVHANLEYRSGNFNPVGRRRVMSAHELAQTLLSEGCKVYYTGHSLGGGLATLMGAYVSARPTTTNQALASGNIVTFGSPPVGNQAFCAWFDSLFEGHDSQVAWRFIKGDEFAPMAPPLPFVIEDTAREFRHVAKLIQVNDLLNNNPDSRNYEQMVNRMNQLSRQDELYKVIIDHNVASTLRALRDLHRSMPV